MPRMMRTPMLPDASRSDNDHTGMRIYTLDDVPFAAAWEKTASMRMLTFYGRGRAYLPVPSFLVKTAW